MGGGAGGTPQLLRISALHMSLALGVTWKEATSKNLHLAHPVLRAWQG